MSTLIGTFSRLAPKKILVAGDLMQDTYTIGKASRISPEAPVAVIQVKSEEMRPGGAGNTILNLVSLGASVVALGRVGEDSAGKTIVESLKKEGVNVSGIFTESQIKTPVKNRIVADNQQIVRVDHEVFSPINHSLELEIIESLPFLLEGVKVVAISDYGKGFLSSTLLNALIKEAKARGIFVIADPKGIDFSKYRGVDLIKPNQNEAYLAAKVSKEEKLEKAASKLLEETEASHLLVTRSEDGIAYFHKSGERKDFPVKAKQVKDVTGAGDTVLAMLSFCIANGISLADSASFANVAASIAIEQFGCARVSLHDLANRLLHLDVRNKIFDKAHLIALEAALKNTPCHLVSLSGKTPPGAALVASLQKQKEHSQRKILALVSEDEIDPLTISMLASLEPIDFILIGETLEGAKKRFSAEVDVKA